MAGLGHLFELCRLADGHAPVGEHQYLDLVAGTPDRSIGRIFEVDEESIAYAHLSPRRDGDGWVLETAIHPGHRHSHVIRDVVQSAVDLAGSSGGGTIRMWVYHPAVAEAVRGLGFDRERQLLQMRMSLPPGQVPNAPAGLRLASFRVGIDEERWIEVNNLAFTGHPENGAWTSEMLADRIRQDWFDPGGLLMAWQDTDLTGFCWTKLHPGDLGEIYVLAVDPEHQRKSLGTWLTLEGLWYLQRVRNASAAMLYVDAANGPAVNLYEQIGFGLDHIDRSFVRAA
jgi:mycothiol synthase